MDSFFGAAGTLEQQQEAWEQQQKQTTELRTEADSTAPCASPPPVPAASQASGPCAHSDPTLAWKQGFAVPQRDDPSHVHSPISMTQTWVNEAFAWDDDPVLLPASPTTTTEDCPPTATLSPVQRPAATPPPPPPPPPCLQLEPHTPVAQCSAATPRLSAGVTEGRGQHTHQSDGVNQTQCDSAATPAPSLDPGHSEPRTASPLTPPPPGRPPQLHHHHLPRHIELAPPLSQTDPSETSPPISPFLLRQPSLTRTSDRSHTDAITTPVAGAASTHTTAPAASPCEPCSAPTPCGAPLTRRLQHSESERAHRPQAAWALSGQLSSSPQQDGQAAGRRLSALLPSTKSLWLPATAQGPRGPHPPRMEDVTRWPAVLQSRAASTISVASSPRSQGTSLHSQGTPLHSQGTPLHSQGTPLHSQGTPLQSALRGPSTPDKAGGPLHSSLIPEPLTQTWGRRMVSAAQSLGTAQGGTWDAAVSGARVEAGAHPVRSRRASNHASVASHAATQQPAAGTGTTTRPHTSLPRERGAQSLGLTVPLHSLWQTEQTVPLATQAGKVGGCVVTATPTPTPTRTPDATPPGTGDPLLTQLLQGLSEPGSAFHRPPQPARVRAFDSAPGAALEVTPSCTVSDLIYVGELSGSLVGVGGGRPRAPQPQPQPQLWGSPHPKETAERHEALEHNRPHGRALLQCEHNQVSDSKAAAPASPAPRRPSRTTDGGVWEEATKTLGATSRTHIPGVAHCRGPLPRAADCAATPTGSHAATTSDPEPGSSSGEKGTAHPQPVTKSCTPYPLKAATAGMFDSASAQGSEPSTLFTTTVASGVMPSASPSSTLQPLGPQLLQLLAARSTGASSSTYLSPSQTCRLGDMQHTMNTSDLAATLQTLQLQARQAVLVSAGGVRDTADVQSQTPAPLMQLGTSPRCSGPLPLPGPLRGPTVCMQAGGGHAVGTGPSVQMLQQEQQGAGQVQVHKASERSKQAATDGLPNANGAHTAANSDAPAGTPPAAASVGASPPTPCNASTARLPGPSTCRRVLAVPTAGLAHVASTVAKALDDTLTGPAAVSAHSAGYKECRRVRGDGALAGHGDCVHRGTHRLSPATAPNTTESVEPKQPASSSGSSTRSRSFTSQLLQRMLSHPSDARGARPMGAAAGSGRPASDIAGFACDSPPRHRAGRPRSPPHTRCEELAARHPSSSFLGSELSLALGRAYAGTAGVSAWEEGGVGAGSDAPGPQSGGGSLSPRVEGPTSRGSVGRQLSCASSGGEDWAPSREGPQAKQAKSQKKLKSVMKWLKGMVNP